MRLRIERLAYGGDGVAHHEDGRAAFVPMTAPGDVAEVRITEESDRYVRAEVLAIEEPSDSRVTPPCPYFGVCGGCQWQHIAYETQLEAKTAAVGDALTRIGKIDPAPNVAACVPSPNEYGYRNKIELVTKETSGRLDLGFSRAGSNEFVAVEECLLLPGKLKRAPKALQGALRYLSRGRDLGLVRVGLRVAANTKDVEVALWTTPGPFPRELAADAIAKSVGATSVVRCLIKGDPVKRDVSKVEVLKGKGAWRERLAGHSLLASAPSFFQVNTPVAEEMVASALEMLDPGEDERVLDLYSGVGTFTLPLSERAYDVTALEGSKQALLDLRRNLEAGELFAELAGGDASRTLPELGEFNSVLVDPPRSGLADPVMERLIEMGPKKLVYVSCDPTTLARDARRLTAAGMDLVETRTFDLFPQSFHVESIALFKAAQST